MSKSTLKFKLGLSALLFILHCCLAYSDIYIHNAPQFSEQNRVVSIRAYVDGSPQSVILDWTSAQGQFQMEMASDAEPGYWSAAIPAQNVLGDTLFYKVIANDGQTSQPSPDYTLYICPEYTKLKLQAMALNAKVIAKKKWNNGQDAFGLKKSDQGAETGPASIAYEKGIIYILDSANCRILHFDSKGQMRAPITVPTDLASDIAIDDSDSSLFVIAQLEDKAYRLKAGKLFQTLPLGLNRKLVFPAKFSYNSYTETLYAEDTIKQNQRREVIRKGVNVSASISPTETAPEVICDIAGNSILLRISNNPQIFAAAFDQTVFCLEESAADSSGIVWILFTLEGDYRIRRLARIDTLKSLAQTAQTDIWFSFDATRRMALTENGIVLFAGDAEEGRIVRFDYNGSVE